jgi:nucleotide-binding universal stress UspA family protein
MGGKVMTRILVPTDFSEPSLTAVRSGIELATTGGGIVFLLHVVEGASVRCYTIGERPLFLKDISDPGGEYFRSRFNQKLIRHDFCEEAHWKLDALVPPGCRSRIRTVVTAGRVVDEIIRVAEEQCADLILLGVRERRGWRHVFRRTVADRVRRKALIPVVTLAADEPLVGRNPEGWDVPVERLGSARSASHSAELIGVVQDADVSHRLRRGDSTARPCEAADDDPVPTARPLAAEWDERSGRQAHQRSRTINV